MGDVGWLRIQRRCQWPSNDYAPSCHPCTYRQVYAGMSFSTAHVAAHVGVHKDTLLRWLREGLVPEPNRDNRGWRVFTEHDLACILEFAHTRAGARSERGPHPTLEHLRGIDWDFRDAQTNYLTHRLHPYPAKFIPQIPNALIQGLSSVGCTVLDPFCGSGTTLVEALLLKRHAVGVDASPLACLISKAKTLRLDADDHANLYLLSRRAEERGNSLTSPIGQNVLFEFPPFSSDADRPDDETLAFWFEPFVVEELAEIRSWCQALGSDPARLLALAVFSSIIVAVSKQDSDTRYVRREKGTTPGAVFQKFGRALRRALVGAAEFVDLVEPRFRCDVIEADASQGCDVGPVDLVVCSPPYPNAYSYHLYHRTRMIWLGMDQPRFKKQEIGSHRKYSSKAKDAATSKTFLREMETMFAWVRKALRVDGFACLLVGDSTIRGERVNNVELISKAAAIHGFSEIGRLPRQLQATRKAFNPKIGNIKSEVILILQNKGVSS